MKKYRKITDIQVKNNNIKRRKIYIDQQLFIEIDDTIVSELDLYIGKEVTDHLIDIIQQKEALTKAKNDSIRFLSYRPRSEWEIKNKLKDKKYQSEIIEKTIKVRVVSVEIESVEDVMFYGGKVTTEPAYEKTYNQSLAEKLDHEIYSLLREEIEKVSEVVLN